MKKQIRFLFPYIALLTTLLVFIIIGTSSAFLRLNYMGAKSLNEGWTYIENGQEVPIALLPSHLDIKKDVKYSIYHTLNDSFNEPQVILIRASLQDVEVRLDDQLLYEVSFEKKGIPYASSWHLVLIPSNSEGSTLTITLSSPYQAMSGIVNEVYHGTTVQIYAYLFRTYGFRLFFGLTILLIGLTMMVMSIFIDRKHQKGSVYFGLFSVYLSLWIIAESRLIQLFTGSQYLIGSLAYIALILFPLPILYYCRNYIIKYNKKPYTILIIAYLILGPTLILLQSLDIRDFFETVIISHIFLVIVFLVATITLGIEIIKHQNNEATKFTKYLVILMISAIIELIFFFINNFRDTSIFILTGLVIFMFAQFIGYVKYLVERLKLSYQSEMYESLAYIDILTGGKNRLAYESDFEDIFSSQKKEHLRLVFFDFDDLKKVNDIYGHLEGDEVLKKGFSLIKSTFGMYGECYRIGGDEFACLMLNKEHDIFKMKLKEFFNEIEKFNSMKPYKFSISMGSSIYHTLSDYKPSDLILRADQEMYQYKMIHKKSK